MLFARSLWSCSLVALLTLGVAAGCGDSGTTGAGGSGGTGATGGAGGGTDPLVIDAPAETWTWVDFPDSQCMNGTPTGIGVNPGGNGEDVLIVLQGGNACFNTVSCSVTANKNGYGQADFETDEAGAKLAPFFDRTDPNNVFKDFSYVDVPYCSGDLHFGDKADSMVGGKARQFHGYKNTADYLTRLVPTFKNAKRVVLLGLSAGAFGAALNYDQVATAFGPGVEVVLLDDSGPPMANAFVPPCLQKAFLDRWGYESSLCPTCVGADGSFTEQTLDYVAGKYPNASLNLISSEEDETIRNLLGFGNNDCAQLDELLPPAYDPALYTQGLVDLRDRVFAGTSFRTFYIPGSLHVWTDKDTTATVVDGVSLHDWVAEAITSSPSRANVPAN